MQSDSLALLLCAVALVVALLGTWDVLMGIARREELRERALGEPPRSLTGRAWRALDGAVARSTSGRKLGVQLAAAAVKRTPLQFLLIALAVGLALFAAATFAFAPVLGAIAGAVGIRGAFAWLERKREQRRTAFVGQLPELARLLSNGTSAGLGVNAALAIATQELDEPASSELRIVLEEVRIGSSFDAALEHLSERMPSRELGVLVNTLVVQARSGGDLVRALGDMALTLDQRKETLREVRTLMSGAVAVAYVVAALGVASLFIVDQVQKGALDAMTHTAIGLLIIAIAAALYAVAFLIIKRMTRIET